MMKDKILQIKQTFTDAVVSVLETMARVETIPGKAFTKAAGPATGDISGVIGMSNNNGPGRGSMSLTFTNASALGIVGKMLGEEIVEVNKDVVDAVGEMTNMVCGQGRKGMADFGIVYSGAIPTVVTGTGHTIKHVSTSAVLAIPCDTEYGPVTVEICFG
jgi:chemotaxis protein CheX